MPSPLAVLITAIGVSYFLQSLAQIIFGASPKYVIIAELGSVSIGGISISVATIITLVASLIIMTGLTLFVKYTKTGRAMLAMKNSTAAAQAMGISLIKYRLMAFIICTAYASVSGVLLMMVVRSADATDPTGYYALITSLNILAAVIIGGYKSIWGAVFGTFVMYGIKLVIFNQIPFLAKNSLIITLVSGILVIFIAMYYPGGLAQLLLEAKTKIKSTIKKIKEGIYGKDLG